jgi:AcrR family transcriptional regulator
VRNRGADSTREEILLAAERVLRQKGLAACSTRAIAREAGCSDGILFYHFPTRLDLLLALLLSRPPNVGDLLANLPLEVGEKSVDSNLAAVLERLLEFHLRVLPVLCCLFAEPELLARYRVALKEANRGPHLSRDAIAAYLRAEQKLGRVGAQREPARIAELLQGASFQRAFRSCFFEDSLSDSGAWALSVARELLRGDEPKPSKQRRRTKPKS